MSASAKPAPTEQVDTHSLQHVHLNIGGQTKVLYFPDDEHGAVNAHLMDASGRREPVVAFAGLGTLAWVTGPADKTEIAVYVSKDKGAQGQWYMPDGAGGFKIGTEVSKRKGGRKGGGSASAGWGDGRLEIISAKGADGRDYRGSLKVTPRVVMPVGGWQAVDMEWNLADGKFVAFGLQRHGTIFATFCLSEDKSLPFGVGVIGGGTGEGAYLTSAEVRPTLVTIAPHNHPPHNHD